MESEELVMDSCIIMNSIGINELRPHGGSNPKFAFSLFYSPSYKESGTCTELKNLFAPLRNLSSKLATSRSTPKFQNHSRWNDIVS